jgi:hypothetical protein
MKFGIINGAFKSDNYDHIKALEIACGKNPAFPDFRVDYAQLYLNENDLKDDGLIERINDFSKNNNIGIISHVQGIPENDNLDLHLKSHGKILEYQEDKKSIIHYDPNKKDEMSALVHKFNDSGIKIHIENYHRGIIKREERLLHDHFVDFIVSNYKNFDIGAVIDIGRYFILEKDEIMNPKYTIN